ncbi:MAG: protein jag [Spirochaetia bacterium]|jgi:spoIIIJ-associated protein|nr:protein jag [Spirochaetia bacterium]
MIKEFEGRSEQEAIENAAAALNIDREEFDVEILDVSKKSLFRKGNVKIKVYIDHDVEDEDPAAASDFEGKVITYLEKLIELMGYPGKVEVTFREEKKLGISIVSDHSGILIGKKGKNLDAIQLILNVYAGQLEGSRRVIVDAENYRNRHEENIIRQASRVADQVIKTKRSKVLEPMNPFERRLVHTALNEFVDVETKSEGEGLYRQVRIIYKGSAS